MLAHMIQNVLIVRAISPQSSAQCRGADVQVIRDFFRAQTG
jgi:hypothetical protein